MARASLARAVDRARASRRKKGIGITLKRGVLRPWNSAAATLAYYRRRDRYPQNLIFIAGLPKSGSTWLASMMCSLEGFRRLNPTGWTLAPTGKRNHDIYPDMISEFRRKLAVVKGHTVGTRENVERLRQGGARYIITVRDPRDQLVSAYWYIRRDRAHANHEYARSLSLGEWLQRETNVSTAKEHPAAWMRSWRENRDTEGSLLLKYEDLLADTAASLSSILSFLGFEDSLARVDSIVDAHSFERVTGRRAGDQDTESFVRRGKPGEWVEAFTEQQKRRFAADSEDVVTAYGYEPTL